MKWHKEFKHYERPSVLIYEIRLLGDERGLVREMIPLVETFIDTLSALSAQNRLERGYANLRDFCQQCGCKLDGEAHGGRIGCRCKCHEGA